MARRRSMSSPESTISTQDCVTRVWMLQMLLIREMRKIKAQLSDGQRNLFEIVGSKDESFAYVNTTGDPRDPRARFASYLRHGDSRKTLIASLVGMLGMIRDGKWI